MFLFEQELVRATSAMHPSKFLLSTSYPGLTGRIGLLKQNWVLLEHYMEDDPDDGFYEELE